MKSSRNLLAVMAMNCLMLGLSGCGSNPSQPKSAPRGGKVIGVTLLTKQHAFYQDLEKGLLSEAGKKDYRVKVLAAEFDPAKQANQVEDFIAEKVDAIVVSPCDSYGIGAAIAEANKANIPVFTADIANLSKEGQVAAHIASDNMEGGRRAGELLAKAINGKGKIAIINHPTVASVLDRVEGFRKVIAKYPDITIAADVSASGQRANAMKVAEDILQKHADLKGIFGINDDSALGALAAVTAAGKRGKIAIVGYDATPEAKKAIADGGMYGDAIQYPDKIGMLTVQTISDYFDGKPVQKYVPVEVGSWTGADAK
jgi:ribose transport system substrate-binding protein